MLVMAYGIVGYVAGMASVVWLIGTLAGLAPYGFLIEHSLISPILWNSGLVAIWGIIHSGMARQGFKSWLTGLLPEPAERPTYVLMAGLTTIAMIGCWQTAPGVIWSVTGDVSVLLLWGIFAFGWVYLVAATFAINHFDLFGLRQAYYHFVGRPRPRLEFVQRAMYRVTRHPIQTGVLIGVWATPVMTATQIVLSVGFTVYIFIGLWFEERDLIVEFGDEYIAYKKEAGMVLPRFRARPKGSD